MRAHFTSPERLELIAETETEWMVVQNYKKIVEEQKTRLIDLLVKAKPFIEEIADQIECTAPHKAFDVRELLEEISREVSDFLSEDE